MKKILIAALVALILIATFQVLEIGDFDNNENRIYREIALNYKDKTPEFWNENVPGVVTKVDTDEKIAFLTLDACADEYDRELIDYLKSQEIPATLFVASPWLEENKDVFMDLDKNPLFSIAGHGEKHIPLSVDGSEVYGEKGTESPKEVIDEVVLNKERLEGVTNEDINYFRSGTAHYDELAVSIVNDLDLNVIGFTVVGDGGATFSKEQIKEAFMGVEPGGIILAHMNRPDSEIAEGVQTGIDALQDKGFEFKLLEDYEDDFILY